MESNVNRILFKVERNFGSSEFHFGSYVCKDPIKDITLHQNEGIPIGSDPATYMANLFLYYDENQYRSKIFL